MSWINRRRTSDVSRYDRLIDEKIDAWYVLYEQHMVEIKNGQAGMVAIVSRREDLISISDEIRCLQRKRREELINERN